MNNDTKFIDYLRVELDFLRRNSKFSRFDHSGKKFGARSLATFLIECWNDRARKLILTMSDTEPKVEEELSDGIIERTPTLKRVMEDIVNSFIEESIETDEGYRVTIQCEHGPLILRLSIDPRDAEKLEFCWDHTEIVRWFEEVDRALIEQMILTSVDL